MAAQPAMRHGPIRAVRQDENHNAFTDLCRYRDRFYLAFRCCPGGHGLSPRAWIAVLASADGEDWSEVFTFAVDGRDTRDPHFLVFKDRLFVYSGTWLQLAGAGAADLNDHLGFAAWTDDGDHWHGPQIMEGTYGHYIWKAAAYGDRAYLCGRRRRGLRAGIAGEDEPESIEAAMLESEDGLVWRYKSLFAADYGDETDLLFESDGSALALVRGGGAMRARLCRADPPWAQWNRTELGRHIGGPMLKRWGDWYLVGGRKTAADGAAATLFLYWLVDGELREALNLPSGGDCSYPGFVPLDERRGLLSYYSSHEGPTSVYVTEVSLG